MTLEAEPVSPGEALSGKLSGKLIYSASLIVNICMFYLFINKDL